MPNSFSEVDQLIAFDQEHIWHPYSASPSSQPLFLVESAAGVYLHLANGKKVIDGMSSWWSTIHGYNHPEMNEAIHLQLEKMSHVMFGGLTHEPAIKLTQKLIEISPKGLEKVFFSDSGSVSVEVAMKMAIQYWQSQNNSQKSRFISLKNGYHGDTFGAMSVCDPVTGMHHLFSDNLPKHIFADSPDCCFHQEWEPKYLENLIQLISENHENIAALILEPIVQGAGGMKFYSPEFLREARRLCNEYDLLLITDEIATGFGRTGKLFACEWANISPDIMCVGKALTGGYLTMAATLCSTNVANKICEGEAQVFMHGPTFMANPLACATALKSIELIFNNNYLEKIKSIEALLTEGLNKAKDLDSVKDVRTLGAIGVVEMHKPVDLNEIQPSLINEGIWLRPFGKLVYMMPPYISDTHHIEKLTDSTIKVLKKLAVV